MSSDKSLNQIESLSNFLPQSSELFKSVEKRGNNFRSLILSAIPLFASSYGIVCLYGLNFRSLFCVAFVILSCGPLFFVGIKNLPNSVAFSFLLPLAISLSVIIGVDGLSAFGKIQIAKTHDLDIIPAQRKLVSPEGYLTAVQVANYNKKEKTPGQVSAYLPNNGFYELRDIEIKTDRLGLRNPPNLWHEPLRYLVVGDSYTFGYGSDQTKTVTEFMKPLLGAAVYNAGVYGAGTTAEVELVDYLVSGKIRFERGGHIILNFFEGNDFTDTNVYTKKIRSAPFFYFKNFVQDWITSNIFFIAQRRVESLVWPEVVDSQAYRVFDSPKFGKIAFHPLYWERVIQINRAPVEAEGYAENAGIPTAFKKLKSISDKLEAYIHVNYIPERSAVYGKYFDEHPEMPKQSYMSQTIERLSQENGFSFLDLKNAFEKKAEEGVLLYWRDDLHFNDNGNELVAKLSFEQVKGHGKKNP